MVKRMLVDAVHPEETRVVVLDGTRLDEFDLETSTKKQNKGNIYLAKVVRVEPSLQAAFVDYGGNRHGFLAFSEIHPDYYQIPVADREALLAEVKAHDEKFHDEDEDDVESANSGISSSSVPQAGDIDNGVVKNEIGSITDQTSILPPPEDSLSAQDQSDGSEFAESVPISSNEESADGPSTDKGESETAVSQDLVTGESSEFDPANKSDEEMNNVVDESDKKIASNDKPGVEEIGGEDEAEENLDIHRRKFVASRRYKIQEVIKRRQILLVQVVKEERGTKGAALTTYLSLAGRYCVLMPNSSRGGGVSRKITNTKDRRRLKSILSDLNISDHMAVILRTAGAERSKAEVKRDYEYLQRTWNHIREITMESRAPSLIHEEANLIKRSIRDIYSRDIEEILVEGEESYKIAKEFMKTLTPSHAKKVKRYKDASIPLLHRYQVESQLDAMHSPTVQLKSGGSIVFGQTEALVAIDVNSGRATKGRHIEETALKTNIEAANEIARQLRLRDLAGLIVIDFIDMDEHRNNHAVERQLKEALKSDRARIQVGRISHFGLLELSRQRLRPSLIEANFEMCKSCGGTGMIRSIESTSIQTLRAIEEEGLRQRSSELSVSVHPDVALYILNYKRTGLEEIQKRYGMKVYVLGDEALIPPDFKMERVRGDASKTSNEQKQVHEEAVLVSTVKDSEEDKQDSDSEDGRKRQRKRKRKRRGDGDEAQAQSQNVTDEESTESDHAATNGGEEEQKDDQDGEPQRKGRRRGRRGGRGRHREPKSASEPMPTSDVASDEDQRVVVTEPLAFEENKPISTSASPNLGSNEDDPIPVQPVPSIAPKPPSRFLDVFKRGAEALLPSSPMGEEAQYEIAPVASDVTENLPTEKTDPVRSETADAAVPLKPAPEDLPEGPPRRGWWNRKDG